MKLYILIPFFAGIILFAGNPLAAQDNPEIDSLVTLLETTEGEERLQLLFTLAENNLLSTDDRQEYSEDAIAMATDLSNSELLVEAYLKHGLFQYDIDDNNQSIETFETAYRVSEENNYPYGMATSLMRIGNVYNYLEDTTKARNHYYQSIEIARENKFREIEAKVLYYYARNYSWNGEYDHALNYFEQARIIAEEINDISVLADIVGGIGQTMSQKGNFPEATKHYEEAADLFNQVGKKFESARMHYLLAAASMNRADYDLALGHLQKALPIFEELNSAQGIAAVTNTMGVIYFRQELLDKALEFGLEHLEKSRDLDDKADIASALNNIGNIYNKLAEDSLKSLFGDNFQDSVKIETTDKYLEIFDEALRYYNEAFEVREEMGDGQGMITVLTNIGIIYVYSGKPAMALEPLERARQLNIESAGRMEYQMGTINLLLGEVYMAFGNYPTALDYLNSALELSLVSDTKEITQTIYQKLAEVHEKQNNYIQSLKYFKLYFASFEKFNTEDKLKSIADMQVKYETEATEKQNALLQAEGELDAAKLKQIRVVLAITILAIGVFIVMMLQLIRQNNLKKKANRELALKNDLITEQKKEITDSIQYASRIQNAMLPPGDYVDSLMPERFILYMPRDIVSGDYYYITEKEGKVICVAADCTGHGVPGAFMSMLGIAFLNEIISKHTELHSDQILGELRNHIIKSLHQTGKEGGSQDGMDVALFILDRENKKIEFSGANNSLLIYRNGELIEAKADKMPIGIHTRHKEPFTRHSLDLQKGDMVYTFTDGYPDQFGGPRQKKFMIKKFKLMLQDIHMKSMDEQLQVMQDTLSDWMVETEQVDDILVIGIRI